MSVEQNAALLNGTHVFWITRGYGPRHAYMRCQMDALGLANTHVSASSLKLRLGNKTALHGKKRGCVVSHIVALSKVREHMRRTGADHALILEDDVDLESGLRLRRRSVRDVVGSLPRDWEVLQLGYHTMRSQWLRMVDRTEERVVEKRDAPRWSLLSYVVSRRAVDAVDATTRLNSREAWVFNDRCRTSADDCVMAGRIVGRPWKAYYLQPPMFWEPTIDDSTTFFESSVGSNSHMHAYSSTQSARWASRVHPHAFSGGGAPVCREKSS